MQPKHIGIISHKSIKTCMLELIDDYERMGDKWLNNLNRAYKIYSRNPCSLSRPNSRYKDDSYSFGPDIDITGHWDQEYTQDEKSMCSNPVKYTSVEEDKLAISTIEYEIEYSKSLLQDRLEYLKDMVSIKLKDGGRSLLHNQRIDSVIDSVNEDIRLLKGSIYEKEQRINQIHE